jgi:hypothetical protein
MDKEKLEDIITPEELAQFYSLAEKMQKFSKVVEPQEEQSNEKPSLIQISVVVDLIKEGVSVTVSDSLLERVKTNYQIPLTTNQDHEQILKDLLNDVTMTLEQYLKKGKLQ